MTLVFNALCGNHAFHASDRLITLKPGKVAPYDVFDPYSNKTVVVIGSDCWVVIGYSGRAYLGGKPTDQFIAEAVCGFDLTNAGIMIGWRQPPGLNYREILRRIHAAYLQLPQSQRNVPVVVSGVGLQMTPRGLRKRVAQGRKTLGRLSFGFDLNEAAPQEQPIRNAPMERVSVTRVGSVDEAVYQAMRAQLLLPGVPDDKPEDFLFKLMDGVAATGTNSSVSDVVGDDVMGVMLSPLDLRGDIYFRVSDPERQAAIARKSTGKTESGDVATISTPYVLMPGAIFGPSVTSSGSVSSNGRVKIRVHGLNDDTPGDSFTSSQFRKPPPRGN